MFSIRLLTFTSWLFPVTHFSTSFKTISVYLARKTSRISIGSLRTMRNLLVSPRRQKYQPTNKCQKLYFMEILFQNDSFFTGTWTCQVRLPIPSMQLLKPVFQYKADNCNICIKIVIMFFCIEFQKSSSC